MKNKFLYGAFWLIAAAFVCKILGAMFRIPLTEIIGAGGIGLYQLVVPVYSLLYLLVSGGMGPAISKLVSAKRAKAEESVGILRAGLIYTGLLGLLFSVLLIVVAEPLSVWQGAGDAKFAYMAVGGAVVFSSVITVFRGYLQGQERMAPTAISQMAEQFVKVGLGISLAYLLIPKGLMYGAFGAAAGILAGEIIASLYLFASVKVGKNKVKLFGKVTKSDFTKLLKIALPLTLIGLVLPFCTAIDSIFETKLLAISGMSAARAVSLFGLYSGMVISVISLPVVIVSAIGVNLLPRISYRLSKGDNEGAQSLISTAFRWVWLLLIPAGFGIIALAPEILKLLFPTSLTPEMFSTAVQLLYIGAVSLVFMGIMQITAVILQGIGKIRAMVISFIIGGVIRIALTFSLTVIPNINIFGPAISALIMYAIIALINLAIIEKNISFRVGVFDFILPIIASVIMAAAVYMFASFVNLGTFTTCLVSLLIGIVVYGVFLIGNTLFRRKL